MHIYQALVRRWERGEKKLLKDFTPFQKKLWYIWMFLLSFYAVTFPLYLIVDYVFQGTAIQSAVATLVTSLLTLSGVAVRSLDAITFYLPEYGWTIEIIRDCVGWKSSLALAGLILAVRKVDARTKMKGILASVPVIFFANILRIYTSIVAALLLGVEKFSFIHDVLWQATMAVLILGLWMYWLKENKIDPLVGKISARHPRLTSAEIASIKLFISRKF